MNSVKIGLIFLIIVIILIILAHYYSVIRFDNTMTINQITDYDTEKIAIAQKNNTPVIVKNFIESEIQIDYDKIPETSCTQIIYSGQNWEKITSDVKLNIGKIYKLFNTKNKRNGIDFKLVNNEILYNIMNPGLLKKLFEKSYSTNDILYKILQRDIFISLYPMNYRSNIIQIFNRFTTYVVIKGEVSFNLYHPKYISNLKKRSNNANMITYQYPNNENINYITVIVRQSGAIILPYNWAYDFNIIENAEILRIDDNNMFSNIIYKFEK